MIKLFLRAKHWQVFLLLFGLFIIFQFFILGSIFAEVGSGKTRKEIFSQNFLTLYLLNLIVSIFVFFGWCWSVGVGLQHKLPKGTILKVVRFKILLTSSFLILLGFLALNVSYSDVDTINPNTFALILPFLFFIVFCQFYVLFFVTKTIKTIENQKPVYSSDFIGEFFLICVFPVGIWFIQPRINKIMRDEHLLEDEMGY